MSFCQHGAILSFPLADVELVHHLCQCVLTGGDKSTGSRDRELGGLHVDRPCDGLADSRKDRLCLVPVLRGKRRDRFGAARGIAEQARGHQIRMLIASAVAVRNQVVKGQLLRPTIAPQTAAAISYQDR